METTPAISRSGRVLKKSAKLLEMETETIGKSPRQSGPKPGKISIIGNDLNTTLSNDNIIKNVAPNNIRLKLNLSNHNQQLVQPSKITVVAEPIPITNNQAIITTTTTTPIQIRPNVISAAKSSPTIGSLIFRVNNNSIKRPHENTFSTADVKRIKPNEPEEKTKSPIQHNIHIQSKDNQSPVVRIIANQQQSLPQQQQQQQQTLFKSTLSPISDKTTMNQDRLLNHKSFTTSTPKINTIIASRQILPRSIQEQRRINQANRARLQMQQQQQLKDELRQKQLDSANIKQQQTENHHNNNNNEETIKTVKKPAVSAYVLWCKENRSHIQSNYPELDFCNLSKKMGGIWHTLPKMEKDKWIRKAQLMTKYGIGFNMGAIYDYDDEDLKPEIVLGSLTLPITKTLDKTYGENFINTETSTIEGEKHYIGTELIDAQSYLSILGDSLMTISSYIQRGIKYNSEIRYCPMAAASTLLDTALVSMSTLASITLSLPNVSVNRKMAKKTIENATYFMPPSEF